MDNPVARYEKRLTALKQERQSWEPRWRDLVRFLLPHRGRFIPSEANKGERKDQDIIDHTGVYALNVLASSLMSNITNPARVWFRLSARDRNLDSHAVRSWLDEAQGIIGEILIKSNFYHQVPLLYTDLGGFGTSAMMAQDDVADVVRFTHFPIGSYWVANGSRGNVEVCYRICRKTTAQMVEEYGIDKVSQKVRDQYNTDKLDEWHDVVWATEPNMKRKPKALGAERFPFVSVWYEQSGHLGKFLKVSGYNEFPVMAPRWEVTGEDAYGIGPGATVLGDLKELQMLNKGRSQAVALKNRPPLKAPSSMAGRPVAMIPGGMTFYDGPNGDAISELYKNDLGLAEILENIQDVRQRIKRGLFEDLFLMFAQSDRREITAAEIRAREQEKVLVLGRVLESLNQEFLDPVIDRVFGMAWRAGVLPDPPEELSDAEIRVEYTSVMAQALRGSGLAAVTDLLGIAKQIAQVDGSVLNVVNAEVSLREIADMLGTPAKILRSTEEVAEIAAQQAQAQAQQAQVERAQMAAATAKDLGQTPVGGGTALDAMLQGQQA